MKSIFLLILSLMTGTEALAEVNACQEGWLEIACKYPHEETKYDKVEVVSPTNTIQSNQTGKWEKSDQFFLYHDTIKKFLRLIVKPFKPKESGTYCFKFGQATSAEKRQVKIVEKKDCKTINQTAYRTAKINIRCDYSEWNQSKIKFICKDDNFTCKENLTQLSKRSKGKFTLTDTSSGFDLSISQVSLKDAGVYWCGVKEKDDSYRAGITKIQLEVKNITIFKRSPTAGQSLRLYCKYNANVSNLIKFICKGENQNECQHIGNTTNTSMNGRFMMKDNNYNQTITITLKKVTAADSGTYWCGAENIDKERSKIFISMFVLTVGDMKKSLIISTVVLMLVLLVIIVIIVWKRRSHSQNTESREPHPAEECVYEEVQEHQPGPLTSIYATANNPTNDLTLVEYPVINFQSTSDNKADRESLYPGSVLKWSKNSSFPTDQPSSSTDKTLYSTECVYEEVQEHQPGPLTSIYATANNPKNDLTLMEYPVINFQSTSDNKADRESLYPGSVLKWSKNSSSPTDQPSSSTDKPLYSTVKKIQQK